MFTVTARHCWGKARLSAIASVLSVLIPVSAAATPCNGILPQGDHRTEDVQVGGTCVVDGAGGTLQKPALYVYHNINVVSGGSLTFLDMPIDFHVASMVVENDGILTA